MLRRYINLLATLLVATTLLVSCRNERRGDLYGMDGEPGGLEVTFDVQDFDEVYLRSHLTPEDEHRIENIVIWVFDNQGRIIGEPIISHDATKDFQFELDPSAGTQAGGAIGKGVPFGGTKTKGDVGAQMKLRLKNLADRVKIVAIANFKSQNFALENATTGAKFTSDAQFKAIKDIEQLKALRLNINQGRNSMTSSERFESPLLLANYEVTAEDVQRGKVGIQLVPYVAKITANVKAGPGVTITSLRYHYEKIPTRTDIFNATEKKQGSSAEIKPLSTPTTNMLHNSDRVSFRAESYLMPNYAVAKKAISSENVAIAQAQRKGKGTGYTAFDLRQKQLKEDAADGYVKNGAWEFAPDDATLLVMEAELALVDGDKEKRAILTYTVVLGDFSGVSSWTNPTEADLTKINNYFIESGTHYKYNITINGVDNVIVEADSPDRLVEPNPSVEGTVIGNKPTFVLDSHYEQRTFLLTSSDFDIFKDINTKELKPDAKLQFMVQTPFESLKLVSYNKAEAKAARINGVPSNKVVDNDWIRVYVHDPQKQPGEIFDNNHLPEALYSATKGDVEEGTLVADFWEKTLTVEQFFAWLLENPAPLFDKRNAICITLFVDEYFYQWDPRKVSKEARTRANADRDLWMKFCNTADRKFFLLTGDLRVSADRNSRYTEGTYLSLSQHSIKTIFTRSEEGVRIWGVESIDEHPNRRFTDYLPSSPAFWYNVYTANGWSNSWNLLAGDISVPGGGTTAGTDGGWIKGGTALIMKQRQNLHNGYQEHYWSQMTIGGALGVDMRDRSNYQAVYSPLSRNRDLNRDDKFQASEMKWYIPSSSEVMVLALAESLFPSYAKLDVVRPESNRRDYPNAPLVLFSSTCFRTNAISTTSHNPVVFLPEYFCHVPLLEVLYDASFYSVMPHRYGTALDNFYSTTRLIRDLGVVEDEVTDLGTTYHMQDGIRDQNLNTFMKFEPKYDNPYGQASWSRDRTAGTFVGGFLTPELTRSGFVDGELPTHTERDSAIRIYKKGFRVAGSYAYTSSRAATIVGRYGVTYDDLKGRLLRGESPCKDYFEEGDESDRGKWRLPNILELGLMGTAMPRNYWYYTLGTENGTILKTVWSATTPSFDTPEARSIYSNLFLYIDQQTFWTMNFKEDNFGYPASKSTWYGYVRCVRDLE